jgi:AcrR family transcriptional regulator
MKKQTAQKTKYHSPLRAEAEAATHQRILEAATALYVEQGIDQTTLEQLASRANVSVQTILRHYKNMPGVWMAVGEAINERAMRERDDVPIGDIPAAVANLINHYETFGATGLRTLALEGRYKELDARLAEGRQYHRRWVARVFAPYLHQVPPADRRILHAQLAALCDMYTWKVLRQDQGLSPEQTGQALTDLLVALLKQKQLLVEGDQNNG